MATSPAQTSAYDLLKQTLGDWGLSSLYKYAVTYLQQGLSTDEVTLRLQDTSEYKTRFAGNAERQKNGLGTLSPAAYIALEGQYRQVLTQYGLPAGFYDSTSDFNDWIGGDVSPAELQSRAEIAKTTFMNAPQEYKDTWQNYFGLSSGDAIAAILDPTHESVADLQRQANAVQLGGTAAQFGVKVDAKRALAAADANVSLDTARQAYQRIAQYGARDSQIAQRFGLSFDQNDEVDSLLLGNTDATGKRNLAYSSEGAQFSGRGGSSTGSLNTGANY